MNSVVHFKFHPEICIKLQTASKVGAFDGIVETWRAQPKLVEEVCWCKVCSHGEQARNTGVVNVTLPKQPFTSNAQLL